MADAMDQNGKGFSLSFGGASGHRSKRVKVSEDEERPAQQFLSGFEQNGAVITEGDGKTVVVEGATKRVIPTQGNDFRGMGPRAYNPKRFLPEKGDVQQIDQDEDHFEMAEAEEAAPVQYGLTTMGRRRGRDAAQQNGGGQEPETGANGNKEGDPSLPGRRVLGTGKDWEAEAFQKDVAALPETSTLEEYAAMPVEAFGEAMLRGMGWSEDKEAVKDQAKEFVRRAPLLGLGATATAPQTHKEKRIIRPGESREAKKDLVVYDEKGHIKHTRTADDKLVERIVKGPKVGKQMRIIKGRDAGIRCKVCVIHDQVEGRSQTATVRLYPSEEMVTVRLKELGELDEQPSESRDKKVSENGKHRDRQGGKAERDGKSTTYRDAPKLEERRQEGNEGGEKPWLRPHIRVKIIDKQKESGKLYLKKGEVTDVMSPTLCTVLLDSGRRVDAHQHQLETIVPRKEGSRVLVVSGKLRGQRAKLLQRNAEHSQAAIQLTEDFSVCKVSFDEIAEFVGDLGDEE